MEDINAATAAVMTLRGTMGSVKPLTDVERREYHRQRLGPQTLRVLDNRVSAARQHRHLLPPSFDVRTLERDTALVGRCSNAWRPPNSPGARIKASPGAEEQRRSMKV